MEGWTTGAPYLGVTGLIVAFIIYLRIKAGDAGNAKMVEISDLIHEGAMAFLKREYSILLVFYATLLVFQILIDLCNYFQELFLLIFCNYKEI